MSYTRHTWNNEVISDAKLNNIEDGIEEAMQSGGGIDALAYMPDSITGWCIEGNFATALAKVQNKTPLFVVIINSVISNTYEISFGDYALPLNVIYDSSIEPAKIVIAFNSYSGLEWTSSGVTYYYND